MGRCDHSGELFDAFMDGRLSWSDVAPGEWECTHCNGEGLCWDGADPLGDCLDEPHRCHACGGSGKREDQRVF